MATFAQKLDHLSFDVFLRASEAMEQDLASSKNRNGIVQKYARLISPAAWASDWGNELDAQYRPHMLGARAIEIDMRDRIVEFTNANGLQLPAL